MKIEIGTTLWYVPGSRHSQAGGLRVVKVGRRWAETVRTGMPHEYTGPRIDIQTLAADGGQYASPGRAYESREQYDAIQRLGNLWRQFHHRLSPKVPHGLTEQRIREMAFDCGITLSPPAETQGRAA